MVLANSGSCPGTEGFRNLHAGACGSCERHIANAISCAYRALIAFALASRLGLGLGLAASLLRRFFALATPY
jgi:ABC-type nitrate/sulfonate/bicarbonate transport system permease component